jgi:predicted dehydrogenase
MAGANRAEGEIMTKTLNVGMVGYGFMARAHSNAWANVSHFFDTGYRPVLKAAAARNVSKLRHFGEQWGYESLEDDWRALVARKDIDAIDICVPNDLHAEIAIAAAKAGKMVLSEKPLARTEAEALPMVEAVEKAGVPNMVWYNYRRVPAVTLIKNLVDSGRIGKTFHYRAKFLQDWTISPDVPQGGAGTWRLDVNAAGSGVTGDLLAHCLDTATWINGGITSLTAMTETFIKQRKSTETGQVEDVGIDDAAAVLTRFANGRAFVLICRRSCSCAVSQFLSQVGLGRPLRPRDRDGPRTSLAKSNAQLAARARPHASSRQRVG